ncbi:glycosyl transferase group 1 [Thalassoporum mexicanum PCC 7367]|uniref:glycosyltransferase n=1 Tax=Thalassoporum mexicanum TaxID=3457544 RepID=UPI00029FF3DB|nr:glycosyltransferase [Pseudanabaena sp. PCC 7367]AFY70974.1 glycosyl transferase group 1 [Pseudanabaena sp. PCC 7367]
MRSPEKLPALKILCVASPAGTLADGAVGGVALDLYGIATELQRRGHLLKIVAPKGSATASLFANMAIVEIEGEFQPLAPNQTYDDPVVIPANAVLANMWDYAQQHQYEYDLIINFAYDWLPFYLAPLFDRPVLHRLNLSSWTLAMDRVISRVAKLRPGTIAVLSKAQALSYERAFTNLVKLDVNQSNSQFNSIDRSHIKTKELEIVDRFRCLGGALQVDNYDFQAQSSKSLAVVARISPEKGIEDAIAAATKANLPIKIFGFIQDQAYWQNILAANPQASQTQVEYMGFLPAQRLQQELGKCRALLMTHKCIEAWGMAAIEALACGVPVIAYAKGGPAEIIEHGKSGWLVEPDQVAGLVEAIANLDQIDRHYCRLQAETKFSLPALGDRLEAWFKDVLAQPGQNIGKVQ